jgi:hypothetical protein
MASLPQNRPEKFYDVVVQVAIIRPGPIVGKMMHPYMRRRQKKRRSLSSPILGAGVEKDAGCTALSGATPSHGDDRR